MRQKFFPNIIFLSGIILFFSFEGCLKEKPALPILLLTSHNNFGGFTGEILKAEGFNEFFTDSLGSKEISKSFLDKFDQVILTGQVTDSRTWNIFRRYVREGGNLIAFQPGQATSDLFGIEKIPGNINEAYISIDTSSLEGKGITCKKIQVHGIEERYILKSAEPIAWFCGKSDSGYEFPAVVTNSFGKGRTTAFLYNLPRNIAYTRQGNPDFAGIEKDSIPGLRAMDLFTDGWVDTANNVINQADEQMVLLSHCIEHMSSRSKPLPRLWYFPDTLKCLVTLTNDGEFNGEKDFESQFRDVDSMGAKMSLYVLKTDKVSRQWAERWIARGFEISGHPDDTREAAGPVWSNMDKVLSAKMKEISDLYGVPMSTVVNHWFVWCGNKESGDPEFSAQAEIEARHGLLMDVNYAHYDNSSGQGHFLGPPGSHQGNFTGSGLPMRFAGASGKIIDIYQHLNNVYDQQYTENHDPEGFYACFKGLTDRSLNNEVYSFISIKSHNDEYYFSKEPLMKMLAYASSKGIPVWTASKLAEFVKMRDEARFTGISWSDNRLSFNIQTSLNHSGGLTIMVPLEYGDNRITEIECNGEKVRYIERSVKGYDYAFVTVKPGEKYSLIIDYAL